MTRGALLASAAVGLAAGIGAFTFRYAEGTSYFSSDPRACVNCHVMREPFDSWQKSSHHAAARCVDCHLPRAGVRKWLAKAENGFWHSKGFTLQDFHEPIRIKPRNARVVQDNCLACHGEFVAGIVGPRERAREAVSCVKCHADVGHGARR